MQLSAAARLALGEDDPNAVLVGVGISYRIGATELLGEWAPTSPELTTARSSRCGVADARDRRRAALPSSAMTLSAQLILDVSVASTPSAQGRWSDSLIRSSRSYPALPACATVLAAAAAAAARRQLDGPGPIPDRIRSRNRQRRLGRAAW
jgi:hypothetical protein